MRTFRSKRGQFRERPFLTDNEIEATCVDELQRVHLMPTEPAAVRIDRFIEKRFGFSESYEDLPEGILGLTRFGSNGVMAIAVSNQLEEDKSVSATRRIRTTLAHEAGHGILHNHLFVLGTVQPLFGDWSEQAKPRVLCRDHERNRYQGEWWEVQANKAMASLLIPRHLALKALEPFLQPHGLLGALRLDEQRRDQAIRHLADLFDVNPVVARYRLDALMPASQAAQLSL